MTSDNFDKHPYRFEIRLFWIVLTIFLTLGILAVRHDLNKMRQERFIECSRDEGDAGCDSCYFLVYGKHIDTYSLFYK